MDHKKAWDSQSKKQKLGKGWSPSQKDWVKLNFDAAIRENKTSIAVIARK